MTKIIAFYLPQFHAIPENDEWWGKGFTEWTNTKAAKPLYKGHYQPREPFEDNYYNLLDNDARVWQASLAKENGIDGFCYYHYWFNGRQLLEKPLEAVLAAKEPDFPFCMCWANEPWTRAWDGGERQILMPQEYGVENDWNNHFNYLLKFFKDSRYIKVENKPVFIIYRSSSIPCREEMFSHWNKLCIENGFDGLYLVEEVNIFQDSPACTNSNAVLEFEPMFTLKNDIDFVSRIKRKMKTYLRKLGFSALDIYNYDTIWNEIINRNAQYENKQKFLGAFLDWDNSARKGKNATIIKGGNPEKFEAYFSKQLKKAEDQNCQFIFVNAWNEWAEGTYLEPDKKYGSAYLKAIKNSVSKNK